MCIYIYCTLDETMRFTTHKYECIKCVLWSRVCDICRSAYYFYIIMLPACSMLKVHFCQGCAGVTNVRARAERVRFFFWYRTTSNVVRHTHRAYLYSHRTTWPAFVFKVKINIKHKLSASLHIAGVYISFSTSHINVTVTCKFLLV